MKSAKAVIIKQMEQDALEGRITPVEHQLRYDKLKKAEGNHDIIYYAKHIGAIV